MQYKITVCYKMEDLLYIYAYTDIQLRIDSRCLVVGFLYSSGGLQPPQQAIRKKIWHNSQRAVPYFYV